jgi:hypothetical protein
MLDRLRPADLAGTPDLDVDEIPTLSACLSIVASASD